MRRRECFGGVGVEPPKYHDVGGLLLEHRDRFEKRVGERLEKAGAASKWLWKEREMAFYGDIDFIPTEEYTEEDSRRAMEDAKDVVELATEAIGQ